MAPMYGARVPPVKRSRQFALWRPASPPKACHSEIARKLRHSPKIWTSLRQAPAFASLTLSEKGFQTKALVTGAWSRRYPPLTRICELLTDAELALTAGRVADMVRPGQWRGRIP